MEEPDCAAPCGREWNGPTPDCVAWVSASSPVTMLLQCCLACTYSELRRQKLEAFRASSRSGRLDACGLPARAAVWPEVILHCPLGDGQEGGGGSSHLLPTQPAYFLAAAALEVSLPRRYANSLWLPQLLAPPPPQLSVRDKAPLLVPGLCLPVLLTSTT